MTYTKVDNVSSFAHVVFNVPSNASVVNGSCAGDQWLEISWLAPNTTIANNMTIYYHKNKTTNNYYLKSLNVSFSPELFVNASKANSLELYHGNEWMTPVATSYRCEVATRFNMSSDSLTAASMTLTRLQEEAYRTAPGTGFSAARQCGGADVPDAVPIAVGCALGGLVLVVLVAYLVARRRSAASGYLSM